MKNVNYFRKLKNAHDIWRDAYMLAQNNPDNFEYRKKELKLWEIFNEIRGN
jgi:hypothetical protein